MVYMKKVKKLVVGNWKMNPESMDDARSIVRDIKKSVLGVKKTNIVLCPPFTYLSLFSSTLKSPLFLGAQNTNHEDRGSFTGEVSPTQLYDVGVRFVIVGHSERRKIGEAEELINRKVRAVLGGGMTAIVCVGESARDLNGDYYDFIKQQILSALKDVSKKMLDKVVIAYEPIWAIGAKEAMTPSDLHEISILIRKVLKDSFGLAGDSVQILYGGSVDRTNADRLVKEGNVNGLLVGRESLKSKEFVEIIKLVDSI